LPPHDVYSGEAEIITTRELDQVPTQKLFARNAPLAQGRARSMLRRLEARRGLGSD
jgi:hypothetical protein